MKYRLRNDVTLEVIDNISILIALRTAWNECPFAMQIAPAFAYIWKQLKNENTEDKIIEKLVSEKGMSVTKAENIYSNFIKKAKAFHFLIEVSDQC